MIIISHKHEYIFIHVAKNAGRSITNLLLPYENNYRLKRAFNSMSSLVGSKLDMVTGYSCGRKSKGWFGYGIAFLVSHMSARALRSLLPYDLFNSYFKFCVVRNPWDRCVSRFTYKEPPVTFGEFLRQDEDHISQMQYIVDERGELLVDKVVRFERLTEGLKEVVEEIGLPVRAEDLGHENRSRRKSEEGGGGKSYRDWYDDDELVDFVAQRDAETIEMFGYEY